MRELFTVENELINIGNETFLQGKCIMQNTISGEITYAFYLFHNNQRVGTKWYSLSPEFKFKLSEKGLYHIAAFIKIDEAPPIIIENSPLQLLANNCNSSTLRSATLNIFGSCVSRDCLEFEQASNIELCNFISRQSIVSAVSEPVPINIDDIHLTSSFQKRQIVYDFTKPTFDLLAEKTSQFLLIDLVDERFQLAKYLNSYITYSQILHDSGYLNEKDYYLVGKDKIKKNGNLDYYVEGVSVQYYMDLFCDAILKIYSPNQIILHRVYGAEHYINTAGSVTAFSPNHLSFFKNMNLLYEYMYDYLYKRFDYKPYNIDISRQYLCIENHKWGLAPIHFQEEYYIAVLNELSKYINSNY